VYRTFYTWQYTFESDPIFLGLYLQIWCTFTFIQRVCDILAEICPAQKCGIEAPGWSIALELDSGFGCRVVQAHNQASLQVAGQGRQRYKPFKV